MKNITAKPAKNTVIAMAWLKLFLPEAEEVEVRILSLVSSSLWILRGSGQIDVISAAVVRGELADSVPGSPIAHPTSTAKFFNRRKSSTTGGWVVVRNSEFITNVFPTAPLVAIGGRLVSVCRLIRCGFMCGVPLMSGVPFHVGVALMSVCRFNVVPFDVVCDLISHPVASSSVPLLGRHDSRLAAKFDEFSSCSAAQKLSDCRRWLPRPEWNDEDLGSKAYRTSDSGEDSGAAPRSPRQMLSRRDSRRSSWKRTQLNRCPNNSRLPHGRRLAWAPVYVIFGEWLPEARPAVSRRSCIAGFCGQSWLRLVLRRIRRRVRSRGSITSNKRVSGELWLRHRWNVILDHVRRYLNGTVVYHNVSTSGRSSLAMGGFPAFGLQGVVSGAGYLLLRVCGFDAMPRLERGYCGVSSVLTLMSSRTYALDRLRPLLSVSARSTVACCATISSTVGAICALSLSVLGAMFPCPEWSTPWLAMGFFRFL
uniref:Transmembrane protein n=1 Tax=Macrostomum lignano TaxID=282301 RepID=A0A1I8JRK0_9PLAT